MASIDFSKEASSFREYYNENMLLFHDAAVFFSSLITSLLRETAIEIDSVTSRVKDREECIQKFSRKYREELETTETPYEIKEFVTDLIGIRVVCLYETDVRIVGDLLRKSFRVVDATDKTRALEELHSFGYKGLHLDLMLEADRGHLPEYRRYSPIRVEVQIRTISQDAWSTLDHKIKYKKVIPEELKRRINRLAALFELADQEFILIRDAATAEIKKGEELAEEIEVESAASSVEGTQREIAEAPADPPADVFTFLAITKRHFPLYNFQDDRADNFLQEILQLNPTLTARELALALDAHLPTIGGFKLHIPYRLNPYTEIRHALVAHDRNTFESLLFPSQRGTFLEWLSRRHEQ